MLAWLTAGFTEPGVHTGSGRSWPMWRPSLQEPGAGIGASADGVAGPLAAVGPAAGLATVGGSPDESAPETVQAQRAATTRAARNPRSNRDSATALTVPSGPRRGEREAGDAGGLLTGDVAVVGQMPGEGEDLVPHGIQGLGSPVANPGIVRPVID
jgi:hypothetical protein